MTIQKIAIILLVAGIPPVLLSSAIAQSLLETANFTNNGAKNLNNYSGIMYVKSGAQYGAYQVSGTPFAAYPTPFHWARHYIAIISRGSNPPIEATDIVEFAARLLANGYTTTDRSTYGSSMQAIQERIKPEMVKVWGLIVAVSTALISSFSLIAYYALRST